MSSGEDFKRAGWLELFFDLVFVYAISKIAHVIAVPHEGHISFDAYAKVGLILVPVWWAWTGHTLFTNRFDTGDRTHQLLTLAQMLGAIFLAVFINPDFDVTYTGFLLSYLFIRLVLVAMYLRVGRMRPEVTGITHPIAVGFTLGLLVAASSAFFESPLRYVVLYAGFAIEIATPILLRRRLTAIPVDSHHLPERFGLLTIILLGESVVALAAPLGDGGVTPMAGLAAVLGFVVLSAAWLAYFDLAESRLIGHDIGLAQRVIFGHLPLYAGLTILANVGRFAIDPALTVPDHAIMALIGTALFLGALWVLHGCALWESRRPRLALLVLLLGIAAQVVVGAFGEAGEVATAH